MSMLTIEGAEADVVVSAVGAGTVAEEVMASKARMVVALVDEVDMAVVEEEAVTTDTMVVVEDTVVEEGVVGMEGSEAVDLIVD